MYKKDKVVVTVRMTPELKLQVEIAANADNRTINSWIVSLIKRELERKK